MAAETNAVVWTAGVLDQFQATIVEVDGVALDAAIDLLIDESAAGGYTVVVIHGRDLILGTRADDYASATARAERAATDYLKRVSILVSKTC